MDVWKNGWPDDAWIDEWMERWMDGWINDWMDGWMDGIYGQEKWMCQNMDGLMKYEWMDGWMDGWSDGRREEGRK